MDYIFICIENKVSKYCLKIYNIIIILYLATLAQIKNEDE
jgi:hypothetical protein